MAAWLQAGFAATVAATAAYHLVRLAIALTRRRRRDLDVDLTHAAMGIAMVFMLVGGVGPRASAWWAVGFIAPALWFGARAAHTFVMDGWRAAGHHGRQALTSGAMLYMLVVAAGPTTTAHPGPAAGMSMGATGGPGAGRLIGVALTMAMAAVVWSTVRTAAVTAAGTRTHGRGEARPGGGYPGRARRSSVTANCALAPTMTATCQAAMGLTTVYLLLPLL